MIGNVAKALPAAVPAPNQSQFQANMHLSPSLSVSLFPAHSLPCSFALACWLPYPHVACLCPTSVSTSSWSTTSQPGESCALSAKSEC